MFESVSTASLTISTMVSAETSLGTAGAGAISAGVTDTAGISTIASGVGLGVGISAGVGANAGVEVGTESEMLI